MSKYEIPREPSGGEMPVPSPPSLKQGSILFFLAQVIGNAAYFLTVLILARGLGPAGRGVLAFIIVCALITPRVVNFGHVNATGLYAAQQPARRRVIFGNAFGWALVSSLAGAAVICAALVALANVRPAGINAVDLLAIAVQPWPSRCRRRGSSTCRAAALSRARAHLGCRAMVLRTAVDRGLGRLRAHGHECSSVMGRRSVADGRRRHHLLRTDRRHRSS